MPFCTWTCSTDGKPLAYVTIKKSWSLLQQDCSLMGALRCCCTRPADGNRWQSAPIIYHQWEWNWVGLFLERCQLYLLHMHIWWKPLAIGADNISPVGMELSWIVPWPVPTVLTAHAHLMETAGKRRWCYLIWRLGTELDCSLTGTFYTCCTRTSDGKRWQMVLMLPDLRAWNWLVLILDQCPLYLLRMSSWW